jgi:hypothetical protein
LTAPRGVPSVSDPHRGATAADGAQKEYTNFTRQFDPRKWPVSL